MNVLVALFLFLFPAPDPPKQSNLYLAKDIEAQVAKLIPVTLEKGEKYSVMVNRRNKAGEAELHDVDSDVFYVLDGEAMFTTGGTIAGSRTTAPGEVRGKSIQGGTTRRIAKGDIVTIPFGTPHWFQEVKGTFTYMIVKIANGPAK